MTSPAGGAGDWARAAGVATRPPARIVRAAHGLAARGRCGRRPCGARRENGACIITSSLLEPRLRGRESGPSCGSDLSRYAYRQRTPPPLRIRRFFPVAPAAPYVTAVSIPRGVRPRHTGGRFHILRLSGKDRPFRKTAPFLKTGRPACRDEMADGVAA